MDLKVLKINQVYIKVMIVINKNGPDIPIISFKKEKNLVMVFDNIEGSKSVTLYNVD